MSFELWTPPPLKLPAQQCTDKERKIEGKCWDLAAVQAALLSGELKVQLTPGAEATLIDELGWTPEEILQFLQGLHKARYNDSEWCLPSNNPKAVAAPADSYVMGFSRITGKENQATRPWIYCKFAVRTNILTLQVFSLHRERL